MITTVLYYYILLLSYKIFCNNTNEVTRFRPIEIWTLYYQFWTNVIRAPKLKIFKHHCKQQMKFFVNYDKFSKQSTKTHYEALLKTIKLVWFPGFCQQISPGSLILPEGTEGIPLLAKNNFLENNPWSPDGVEDCCVSEIE